MSGRITTPRPLGDAERAAWAMNRVPSGEVRCNSVWLAMPRASGGRGGRESSLWHTKNHLSGSLVFYAAVMPTDEGPRLRRGHYAILGVAGVVIATVFAVVASLAARSASQVRPVPDLPGPVIQDSSTTTTSVAPTDTTPAPTTTTVAPTTTAAPTTTTRRPTITTTPKPQPKA